MKIPNGEHAIVDIAKLTGYSLNHQHDEGKHKARVFAAALGVTNEHAQELQSMLLKHVVETDAHQGRSDKFGQRYIIDFKWNRNSQTAVIRSCWIILTKETAPRLTSCFVL
jgi:hypothetical protein